MLWIQHDPDTHYTTLVQQEEEEGAVEVLRHNLKVLQTYSFSSHIRKYLALSLW